MKTKPLKGHKFGRLTVVSIDRVIPQRGSYWLCRCSCGGTRVVRRDALVSGMTRSCGCLHRETAAYQGRKSKTHGMSGTPIYMVWWAMINRCSNQKCWAFKYYGGRGIRVCKRWMSFANFYADMGDCPSGLTLERRNNNGPYSKSNCYWATREEQGSNRRGVRLLTFNGKTQTMSRWAREIGVPVGTLWQRLKRGLSVEVALEG